MKHLQILGWCFVYLVFTGHLVDAGILGPLTETTVDYEFNGNPSQLHRTEFIYTETTNTATSFVGNHQVRSRVDGKPAHNYIATEVARIPAFVFTYIQEACLVKDDIAFAYSRLTSDPELRGGSPVPEALQGQHSHHTQARIGVTFGNQHRVHTDQVEFHPRNGFKMRRKLLIVEYIALGIAVAALAVGTAALVSADRAHKRIDALGDLVANNGASIKELENRAALTDQTLDKVKNSLGNVKDGLQKLQDGALETNRNINQTAEGLRMLRNATEYQFAAERARTSQDLNSLDSKVGSLGNATAVQFGAVYHRIANVTELISNNVKKGYKQTALVAQQVLTLNNIVYDLTHQRQLRSMLSAGVHEFIRTLPDVYMPLVTDKGVAPDPNALLGPNSRTKLEGFTWNSATKPFGPSGITRLMKREFKVYIDTEVGIDNARPSTTWDNLATMYGPAICTRPYCGPNNSTCQDSIDLLGVTTCAIWVEATTSYCTATNSTFEWKTANASLARNAQSPLLTSTICTGTIVVNPVEVFRTAADFNTALQTMCKDSLVSYAPYFMLNTETINSISYPTGPRSLSDCDIDISDDLPLTGPGDQYTLPLQLTHTLMELGNTATLKTLANAQMRVDGRIPGGLDFYTAPFTYTPTRTEIDPVTNLTKVVYDGGAETVACYYATLLSVAKTTLPIYSLSPWTENLVSARVIVETVQNIDPTALDYDVTTSNAAQYIEFTSDGNFLLPQSLLWVGDLPRLGNGPNAIYDIPPELLTVSGGYVARKNKATCYAMNPGTINTWDLPTFEAQYPRSYKAGDCGVSADTFRFERVSDSDGFPLCNIASALPSPDLITGQTNKGNKPSCNGGFVWYDDDNVAPVPSYNCTITPDSGVLLALKGDLVGSPPTMNFGASKWGLSFVYWTNFASTRILSINTADTLLVIDGGQSIVITGPNNGQVFSIPVYHNNANYDPHTVFVAWSSASGGTLDVYVDGLLAGTRSNFGSVATATASSSSYLPLTDILGVRVPGVGANVNVVKYYSTWSSSTQISNWALCMFSFYAALRRCVPSTTVREPNSNTNFPINAPLKVAYQVRPVTDTCYGTDSIFLADETRNGVAFPANQWSLTFWIDYIGDVTNALLADFATEGTGFSVSMTNTGGFNGFIYNATNGITRTITSTPLLTGSSSHFIGLVYNSGTMTIFVNGITVSVVNATVPVASLTRLRSIAFHPKATMGRFYSSQVLSSSQLQARVSCDIPTGYTDPGMFRTPLATCVPDPSVPTNGYCRFPTMCSGHCSAWSLDISTAMKTFTVQSYQCDAGWKGSSCTIPCTRLDNTGQCLPDVDILATYNNTGTGMIPGASVCTVLKVFQLDTLPIGGMQIVKFYHRQYSIRATLSLPSGKIKTVLSGSACPEITSSSPDGTTLRMAFKNPGLNTMQINVQVRSSDIPPNLDCTDDRKITIPGKYTMGYSIVTCGLMTIQVQALSGIGLDGLPIYGTNCGDPLTATSIAAITSNIIDITPEIGGAIAVAQEQTITSLNQNALGLTSLVLSIMKTTAQATKQDQSVIDLLDAYASIAESTTVSNLQFATDFAPNVTLGGQSLTDLLNRVQNSTANYPSTYNITTNIEAIQSNIDDISALQNKSRESAARLANLTAQFDVLFAQFNDLPKGVSVNAESIVNGIKDAGGALLNAMPGAGFLNPGSGDGIFTRLIKGIFQALYPLLIVAAIVALVWYGGPVLLKCIKSRQAKADTSKERLGGHGHIPTLIEY